MTDEQVLEMANEADFHWYGVSADLIRFANLVAAHQREVDARICESASWFDGGKCAAAIRKQE